jgi:hypothetical protein
MGHDNNEQDGGIPSTYISPGEISNFPCPLSVTWSAVPHTDGRPFWRKPLELRGWNRYNGPVYSAGDWRITPRLLHMEMKHAFTGLQQSTVRSTGNQWYMEAKLVRWVPAMIDDYRPTQWATVTNTVRRHSPVATGGQRRPPANFLPPGILLLELRLKAI